MSIGKKRKVVFRSYGDNFINGVGSIINIYGLNNSPIKRKLAHIIGSEDELIIRDDWQTIENDLRNSFEDIKKRIQLQEKKSSKEFGSQNPKKN
jgi:hypothetical protein